MKESRNRLTDAQYVEVLNAIPNVRTATPASVSRKAKLGFVMNPSTLRLCYRKYESLFGRATLKSFRAAKSDKSQTYTVSQERVRGLKESVLMTEGTAKRIEAKLDLLLSELGVSL